MKRRIFSLYLVLGLMLLSALALVKRPVYALTPTISPTPLAKPDLIILSVVGHQNGLAPSGCVLNAINNDLQVTVQNVGNTAAGVFEVSATGRLRKDQAVPSLAAGATVVLTFTDLPADTINVVTVDSTGIVAESQEGNNVTNYTSPTLAPPCTSTPTPPGFKTPTATKTGTPPCMSNGQVAYDHSGGAGMVNVPIFAANNTGTPNPGMVATTGPYGQFKTGCMAGKRVYGQSSGLVFNPTAINVSSFFQFNLAYVAMAFGMPTYTPTPNGSGLPDLTISSVTYLGSNPACINSPKVQVVVANIGTSAANGSFSVSLSGSAAQTVNGLVAGQSVTLIFSATGTMATADSTNVIVESNESNNSLAGTFGLPTQAPTCTPTGPTLTPTRTFTPTIGPSLTPTPTTGGACSPVTSIITAPFTWDGAGVYCWQIATIPSYVNNWNNNSVSINGVNYTNVYVAAGSLPAKINNNYYISFNGSYAWSHLEVR
jgi:hypothetical protein